MELQLPKIIARWRPSMRRDALLTWIGILVPLLLLSILGLLIVWPVIAAGPTSVSGPITAPTTWTASNSPYIVTGDVTVQNGAVLTIEAGVTVSFEVGQGLYVGNLVSVGRLVAQGTDTDPVVFTAYSETVRGAWDGIEFAANSPNNILGYCVIEYAGTGILSNDSDGHVIDHCILRHNGDGDSSAGGAMTLLGDEVSITNNEIYDNESGLRFRKSNGNTIADNQIYDNDGSSIGDGFGIGFFVEGGSGGNDNVIRSNQISDNGGDGLYLNRGDNNQVLDNQIYGNGGHGVWAQWQPLFTLTSNLIYDNDQNGLTYATPNSAPSAIHSNVLCSNAGFDLHNQWATGIKAEGNWFGTNTPSVGAEISGTVDYTPWISMSLVAAPSVLPADGTSTAVVTLTMSGGGHTVPDGHTVQISASLGTVVPPTVLLAGGQATTTYIAGTSPGSVDLGATDLCASLLFTDVLTLQGYQDLAVTKDDGPGLTMVLQPEKAYVISYTLTYSNEGTVGASGVVLTDTLPTGTQVYAGNGWICAGGTCRYAPAGVLPAGARRTAPPLVVEVLSCGDLRNEVTIGRLAADYDPDDNTSVVTTSVPCLPDLAVVKNDNVWPELSQEADWIRKLLAPQLAQAAPLPCVDVGERITYTILYVNSGPGAATQVVLTETVPENTHYAGTGWICAGSICTHTVDSLLPGDGGLASFVVEVDLLPASLMITNEVRIGGAEEDLYPPDNVSRDHTHICEPVGECLQVSKDDNLPCAFPGDEIRYTITFSNTCDWNVSGVVLTETVPLSTTYLTSPGWLPVGGDRYVYLQGWLPAHMTGTVAFAVMVDDPLPDTVTETVNRVCIGREGSAGPEDCFELVTPLPLVPDLRVVKHDYIGPPPYGSTLKQLDRFYQILYGRPYQPAATQQQWEPVRPGDVFSYTITYANMGRAPATGVVLTDTLPDHTTYVGYGWTRVSFDTYVWPVGNLGVGAVGQRNFWVRVGPVPCPEEYLYNWAFIAGNEEECNLNNNWSGEETPVECSGFYQCYLPIIMRGYEGPELPTPTPSPTPTPTLPPPEAYVSDVAVNPETNRVYVASPQLDAVWAVDPTGGVTGDDYIVATIGVGDHPLGLAVVTTTNKIYAANLHSHNVTAINGATNGFITNITVGVEPCKVAADSGDRRVYVAHHLQPQQDGAAAINSQNDTFVYYYEWIKSQGNYGIDVDPEAEKVFVASRDGGLISVQDAYSPDVLPLVLKLEDVDPIHRPRTPFLVAFNLATNHLFVTTPYDDLVVVLDPYDIQFSQGEWKTWQGQRVFALNRINAAWLAEIPVGNGAEEGIAVNPLRGYVYVTNAYDDTLSILKDDANPANIKWVMDLTVGDYPQGVDVDVTRDLIYVGNAESRDLTVIWFNGLTHVVSKTIPLD